MKKTIVLLLLFSLTLTAAASRERDKALSFVPADSVQFIDARRANYRLDALRIDTAFQPQPLVVADASRRSLKNALKAWQDEVAPRLNLAGGQDDECADGQAYAAARHLRAAADLLLRTADSRYADVMESALTNALPAALLPAAPFFEQRVAAQAVLDATGMIYATDDEGIYVNLFANCFATIRTPRFRCDVDQLTSYPHGNRVQLRVSGLPGGGTAFKLRIRLPGWLTGRFPEGRGYRPAGDTLALCPIYVNGREALYTLRDGYAEITRRWTNRDEVYFDLPFSPRFVTRAGDSRRCLLRGPLLYVAAGTAASDPRPDFSQVPEEAEIGARGSIALRYPSTVAGNAAVECVPYALLPPDKRKAARAWFVAEP